MDIWLNDQPDQSEDYEFERPQPSKRMRKRKQRVPTFKHTHVRQQLMEVSGNNMKSVEQSPNRKFDPIYPKRIADDSNTGWTFEESISERHHC